MDSDAILAGRRIGVLRDLFRKGKEFEAGNALVDAQINVLRDHRTIVLDGLSTGLDLVSLMPTLRVNRFELRPAFDAYLRRRGPSSPVKTLADLIATGKYLKGGSEELRFHETMKVGALDRDPEYLSRLEMQRAVRRLLTDLMDRYSLDALVYPVKALPAPLLGSSDDGVRDNPISSTTGLPAIVMPAGLSQEGLPLALEFLGRSFSEPTLIQLAGAYEQVSKARVVPATTPHLPGEVFAYRPTNGQ
jgi:Asp-tRNA(Asn)/Glu-tRNA(Gln) amidotransferase A subunit family amidase